MLDALLGIPLGLAALAYLLRVDHERECIEKAVKGEKVDIHKLSSAYWNKHSATYVVESTWMGMSRQEKAEVISRREQLAEQLANFDPAVRQRVTSVRPRDVRHIMPKRHRENILRALMAGHEVGYIVWFGGSYGFVRPGLNMVDYYFSASEVVGGVSGLTTGEVVKLKLGENDRGLCARSISRYSTK